MLYNVHEPCCLCCVLEGMGKMKRKFFSKIILGAFAVAVAITPVHGYAHDYYGSTITAEQAAQADAIAKSIADEAMANPAYKTDLDKVRAVTREVAHRIMRTEYGPDENKYYRSPYGVLVSGNSTCAGAARTVGRILEFMGYEWTHVNENEWLHQWCILEMDGQIGYADANCLPDGVAGYGEHELGNELVRLAKERS